MRTCSKCNEEKPLEDFYAQKGCKDGRRPDCKDCFNAGGRKYRTKHRERIRDYDRERYANDPTRSAAQKATARKHYRANKEHRLAVQKAYYEANPDYYDGLRRKRRAQEKAVEHQPYSRRAIYDRDGGVCRGCGVGLPFAPNGFEIDHIVPISLGGPDTPANVQLMCRPCNRTKWAHLEGQIHLPV